MKNIQGSFLLDEKDYLTKLVKLVTVLYFDVELSPKELDFFVICLIGLRRGFVNPNDGEFFNLFEENYFSPEQTKSQKASLLCTQRKKLVDKDFLLYDKNTFSISVSPAWLHMQSNIEINITLVEK